MLVVRALSFVVFIALTLALVAWQATTIWNMASLGSISVHPWGALLSAIMLAVLGAELFVAKRFGGVISNLCGWVFAVALYAGVALAIGTQAYLRLSDTQPEGIGTSWFEVNVGSGIVAFLGSIPLILGRGFNLKRLRSMAGVVIAIVALNLALPVQLGSALDSEVGLTAGLAAIALQFFVIVDFFLFRSLLHYFGNGATTFVSLRYLRKRPVSLASVLGVASGICVLIVVNSIMNGFANDYRLQIRSTLSDVMVKVDTSALLPTRREVDAEVWAQCLALVRGDSERALPAWQNALAAAQDAMRRKAQRLEARPGYGPNEVNFTDAFPRARKPEPEANSSIAQWLARLDSPEGGQHRELQAFLPELDFCGQVNPVTIWFHTRDLSESDRNAALEDMRTRSRDALFLPNLREGLDLVGRAAQFNHAADTSKLPFTVTTPQAEEYAYRLQNHTAITAGGAYRDFQPAMIMAVDPLKEPRVSRIGDFLQEAAFQDFVTVHHIEPLADLLGTILLFEAASTVGEGPVSHVGVRGKDGSEQRVISPAADAMTLRYRGVLDRSDKVNWPLLNQIPLRSGLGAEEVRTVMRNAIRSAKKVQRANIGRLEAILQQAFNETDAVVEAAIQRQLGNDTAQTESRLKEATQRLEAWLSPLDDRLADDVAPRVTDPGDLGLLLYVRDYRLRTMPGLIREASARLQETLAQLGSAGSMAAEVAEATPPAGLFPLLERINSVFNGLVRGGMSDAANPSELAARIKAGVSSVTREIDQWYAADEGNRAALRSYSRRIDVILRDMVPETYLPGSGGRRERSLEGAVENWPTEFAKLQRVMQAYASHLPTKTRLLAEETVAEYHTRAEAMLSFKPANALWSDDPKALKAATDGALAIANDGFATNRLGTTPPADVPPSLWQQVSADLRAKAAESALLTTSASAFTSVSDVQQALEALRMTLRQELDSTLMDSGLSSAATASLRAHFAVLEVDEYWQLRPFIPGVIIGDAMANRMRIGQDASVRALVMRLSADESADARYSTASTFAGTGEQEFRVNALFRSGLFQENATNVYGDFDTWSALLGSSRAQYQVAFNLKNASDFEGQATPMIQSVRYHLLHNVKAEYEAMEAPSYALARATSDLRGFFDVTSWEHERESLLKAVEQEKRILTLLLTLIVVLAGVVILIVVYLTVIEKVKDIGILRALGASPWGIRSIFMFNALFIGLFGTVTGSALALLISQNLNAIEDWVDSSFGVRLFPPDIYYLVYIPSVKGADLWWLALNIAVPSTLWAFFCGIFPAVIASRKETIEALHYE